MSKNDEVEHIRAQALALQAAREELRKARPLSERLRRAMDKAKILSTVPSAGISEYTTRGKTEGSVPPAQQVPDFRTELALVEGAVEHLERAVDAEQGLGASKSFAQMSKEEKDRELLKWRGASPCEVATRAPWLGGHRTVERIRAELGVRPSNGLEIEKRAA